MVVEERLLFAILCSDRVDRSGGVNALLVNLVVRDVARRLATTMRRTIIMLLHDDGGEADSCK